MIRIILLGVIALLVLSFFGISLRNIIESPAGQENFAYIWNLIVVATLWVWELIKNSIDFLIFWN